MMRFLRKLFSLTIAWIGVILCVVFIGYIGWPLLSDKFSRLCSHQNWEFCQGDWQGDAYADTLQKTIEEKSISFFDLFKTAGSDILTDTGGKREVRYEFDEQQGIFVPLMTN